MKRRLAIRLSLISPRAVGVGLALAAILLTTSAGCLPVERRKLDEFIHPQACPACLAVDVDGCICAPHCVAAGYHETQWFCLEEPMYSEHSVQQAYQSYERNPGIEPLPLPKE